MMIKYIHCQINVKQLGRIRKYCINTFCNIFLNQKIIKHKFKNKHTTLITVVHQLSMGPNNELLGIGELQIMERILSNN